MLIIEDGSIVAGAESFATAAELVTYAASFGKVIPETQGEQESLLRRAALQMSAMQWKGRILQFDQPLDWPRYGVLRDGYEIASNSIPPQIKAGQMALATEIHADDLDPPELRKGAVTKDRVEGTVERQYAEPSAARVKTAAQNQSFAQFAAFMLSANQIQLVRA